MFGKKKDKGAAKEKPAKKAKKSKPKSNEGISRFGDGGLKTLIVNNIEKVALLAIGLTAVYVAFTSWKTPGLKDSQAPDRLASEIQQAESNMSAETWTSQRDQPERRSQPAVYETRATSDVKPVNPTDYLLSQHLSHSRLACRRNAAMSNYCHSLILKSKWYSVLLLCWNEIKSKPRDSEIPAATTRQLWKIQICVTFQKKRKAISRNAWAR